MQNQLAGIRDEINTSLKAFCDTLLIDALAQGEAYSRDAMHVYCDLLQRGGKRLRGIVAVMAYDMAGGKNHVLAIDLARIIEMLHTSLLVFDDIADRSALRRGGPTAQAALTEQHRRNLWHGDAEHFGEAMAMHIGLAGTYLVANEIMRLETSESAKIKLAMLTNQNIMTTIYGQLNDIVNESARQPNETHITSTLTLKSAYYTFLHPLQCGLALAGSPEIDNPRVIEWATHLGLSFQITDDIIGMFGIEFTSGKNAYDDIREGKMTILIAHALSYATAEQRQQLLAALGNQNLTVEQFEKCKDIMKQTGSLAYATDLAKTHAAQALAALETLPADWSAEGRNFLRWLSNYVTERTS